MSPNVLRTSGVLAVPTMGILAAALLLTACSPTTPSEAPTTPSPTRVSLASPQPTSTPRPSPHVTCQEPMLIEGLSGPILSCEEVIELAVSALAPGHSEIESLALRYGVFCPPNRYCGLPFPSNAHVIVEYVDEPRVVVSVSGVEGNGGVTVTSIELFAELVSPSST